MNNLAAFMVFLWVTGWTVAAIRAGLQNRTAPGSDKGPVGAELKAK
jgi:hypothetical protein